MRKKIQNQMPLMITGIDHQHARELEGINRIFDDNPTITEMVWQDLTHNLKESVSGANGMTAEQVIHAAIIKQMEGCSPWLNHGNIWLPTIQGHRRPSLSRRP